MNEKLKSTLFLALSVGIFVPLWGTFHGYVGIENTWAAFASAAIFFATGAKLKDSIKVAACNAIGLLWGLIFLYVIQLPALQGYSSTLVIFATLGVLGICAILVTSIGIPIICDSASLFGGWAVGVGALGGISVEKWAYIPVDILLSLLVGVFFVGVGISQLHGLLLKLFGNSEAEVATNSKDESTIIKENVPKKYKFLSAEEKMNLYTSSYSSVANKSINTDVSNGPNVDVSELKREIIDLKDFIENKSTKQVASSVGVYKDTQVKIIGICGSPHKKGSTINYLKKALEAAESVGNVSVELIELAGKEIKPCMGCKSDKCHGTCRINDYMQELYPKLRECDGIILASPSYFGTFSGQLKLFLDRLRVMRHTNFQLGNKVVGTLAVAGRRHGGQEITNIDLIQSIMRHNTIIVNDGTAVCQLGATGWSHTFDDPNVKSEEDSYGMQTAVGVGKRVAEIAKVIKSSGLQNMTYAYNEKIGKR